MKKAKHLTIYPKHNHVKFKAITVALLETHGWRGCCTTPSCCLQLFRLVVARRKPVKLHGKWFPPSSPPHPHTHVSSWTIWGEGEPFLEGKKQCTMCTSQYQNTTVVPNFSTVLIIMTLLWRLILMKFVVHKFIPNLHQANVPSSKRGNNVLWFKPYLKILCSDKNCCIVSLTNYEKERSKTIVTWKQSSDWIVWAKNLTTDASVAVFFLFWRVPNRWVTNRIFWYRLVKSD